MGKASLKEILIKTLIDAKHISNWLNLLFCFLYNGSITCQKENWRKIENEVKCVGNFLHE